MQNIERIPLFWNCQKINDTYYFWDRRHNAFFAWKDKRVTEIPLNCTKKRIINKKAIYDYSYIYKWNDKLLLIPHSTKDFLLFDTVNGEETHIPIPRAVEAYEVTNSCCATCVIDRQNAWVIGAYAPYIMKLDLEQKRVVDFVNIFANEKSRFFFRGCEQDETAVYAATPFQNRIYIVDKENMQQAVVTVPYVESGIASMTIHQGVIYVIPMFDECLVKWNIKDGSFERMYYPKGFSFHGQGDREMDFPVWIEDRLYLFPKGASSAVYYDKAEDKIEIDEKLSAAIRQERNRNPDSKDDKVLSVTLDGHCLRIVCGGTRRMLVYDLQTQEVKYQEFLFDEKEMNVYWIEKLRRKSGILHETREIGLKEFIGVVISQNRNR